MVNKAFWLALIATLVIVLFTAEPVNATDVYINGQKITFTSNPLNVNGRLLVPMGEIFTALNAEVEWDAATNCVKGSTESSQVLLYINSTKAYKNGQPINLDAPPLIIDGRTMVPLGFIALSFGCQVAYDGSNDQVVLTTGETNSSPSVAPKVLFDGHECNIDSTPVGFVNGTLLLGLFMTGNSDDYVYRNSCNVITCFYPGSRKVDVYKAHVNSAGLTDRMDLLESFQLEVDPVFCWNKAHDRIDYVMVPLQLYAKAAFCRVEYDSEKNIINIQEGVTRNVACYGVTADHQPICNNNLAFSKSDDVCVYYQTSSPVREEKLVSIFAFSVGNRNKEVYREEVVAKGKDCFWFTLPKEDLELQQYNDKGNGTWFHYLKTADDRQVSAIFFHVVPTGKQGFMYLSGIITQSGHMWLEGDLSDYAKSSGEYVFPSSTLRNISCKSISLETAQITRAKFEMRCLNRDTGTTIYKMQSEPFGDFDVPVSPIPGRYEYALYADGVYQNSVFVRVTDG